MEFFWFVLISIFIAAVYSATRPLTDEQSLAKQRQSKKSKVSKKKDRRILTEADM